LPCSARFMEFVSRPSLSISFLCYGWSAQNWRLELLDFSFSLSRVAHLFLQSQFVCSLLPALLWFCSACRLSLSESWQDGQFSSIWSVQTLGLFLKPTMLSCDSCFSFSVGVFVECVHRLSSRLFRGLQGFSVLFVRLFLHSCL
jgi:hypothetical protein